LGERGGEAVQRMGKRQVCSHEGKIKRKKEKRKKGERFGKQVVDESFFIERLFVFTCGYF
jgi:hypothetical protein